MSILKNIFGDKISTKTATVEAWSEEARDLTVEEISAIKQSAARVKELTSRYPIEGVTPGQMHPAILDLLWVQWIEDNGGDKPETEIVVGTLADAFGLYLNDVLKMKWVEITDQYGISIALRHESGTTVHPRSSVEKRLENRGTGFFSDIFSVAEHQTKDLA